MKPKNRVRLSGFLLSVGCCTGLQAYEHQTLPPFFIADEQQQSRNNVGEGRHGTLVVKGALLASPCSLMVNDIAPVPDVNKGLTVRIAGCGLGGGTETTLMLSTLLSYRGVSSLSPAARWDEGKGEVILAEGNGVLTWYQSPEIFQAIDSLKRNTVSQAGNDALLFLRFDYR